MGMIWPCDIPTHHVCFFPMRFILCYKHLAFPSMLHSLLPLYVRLLNIHLIFSFPPETNAHLARILLSGVRIPSIQHFTTVYQLWVSVRCDTFSLVWRPSCLFQWSVAECRLPFFGRRVGRESWLFLQRRGGEGSAFLSRGGSNPGEVSRVSGLDDVVCDKNSSLRSAWSRVWQMCQWSRTWCHGANR